MGIAIVSDDDVADKVFENINIAKSVWNTIVQNILFRKTQPVVLYQRLQYVRVDTHVCNNVLDVAVIVVKIVSNLGNKSSCTVFLFLFERIKETVER